MNKKSIAFLSLWGSLLSICVPALTAMPAFAQTAPAPKPEMLGGRPLLVVGAPTNIDRTGSPEGRRRLVEIHEALAKGIAAELAATHRVPLEYYGMQPSYFELERTLRTRFAQARHERMMEISMGQQSDGGIEVRAVLSGLKAGTAGGVDRQELWSARTVITRGSVAGRQLWLVTTLAGYDLLDAMLRDGLVGPPVPPDDQMADVMVRCSVAMTTDVLLLKAGGQDGSSPQYASIGYYRRVAEAFSSKEAAEKDAREEMATRRVKLNPVIDAGNPAAIEQYRFNVRSELEHCASYQRRNAALIQERLDKSGVLK